MRVIRAASYRRMPWKNGGGETIEVAVSPEGAGLEAFDWRVSMARVTAPGPFSIFPGIDRTLAVLDGAGLRLSGPGGMVELNGASEPHSFPADTPVAADLVDGAVVDLNVMSRRGTVRHRLTRRVVDGSATLTCVASATLALCRGEVKAQADGVTSDIGRNDTLVVTTCAEVRTEEAVTIYVAEFWKV